MTEPIAWDANADERAHTFGLNADEIKGEGAREVAVLLAKKIIDKDIKDWEATVFQWSAPILVAGGGPSLSGEQLVPLIKQELIKLVAKDLAQRVIPTINSLSWGIRGARV